MKFYIKNPDIKTPLTLQGMDMDNGRVVCGEEFEMFADPNTFPGKPAKLIEIPLEKLSEEQRDQIKGFAKDQAEKPPRHLGITTSSHIAHPSDPNANFELTKRIPDEVPKKKAKVDQPGAMGIDKDVDSRANPEFPEKKAKKKVSKKAIAEELEEVIDGKLPKLSDMYSVTAFADTFPGATKRNAPKILKAFLDLLELSEAGNVDLRKADVRANFFDRMRKKAASELRKYRKNQ